MSEAIIVVKRPNERQKKLQIYLTNEQWEESDLQLECIRYIELHPLFVAHIATENRPNLPRWFIYFRERIRLFSWTETHSPVAWNISDGIKLHMLIGILKVASERGDRVMVTSKLTPLIPVIADLCRQFVSPHIFEAEAFDMQKCLAHRRPFLSHPN